jgi:hypothetical protein
MSKLKDLYPVLIGSVILSMIAFANGYALVYSDTGTYIMSGKNMYVPLDRPIAYGLFIRSFGTISLWTVVLVQNLLTSWILYRSFKFFFQRNQKHLFYFYFTVAFLTLFTGIGWYSNQIMPDLFTPIVILGVFILFFDRNLKPVPFIIMSIVVMFSIVTHFSHLLIASTMSIILVMCNGLIFKKRLIKHQLNVTLKRSLLVLAILNSGWIVMPTINLAVSGEFYTSKSSHIFFMASMADKGILTRFLKDKCDEAEFSDCKLCAYKDSIPGSCAAFIWTPGTETVFYKTGGWDHSKREYDKIIRASLADPKYLSQHLYISLAYGLSQLFENNILHGLTAYRENSAPWVGVSTKYKIESNTYLNSKQNLSSLGLLFHTDLINDINYLLLFISFLMILFIYFSPARKELNRPAVLFLSVMLLGIVINSFVTAGLNSPYGRYQARVSWLMELGIILLMIINWDVFKKTVYRIFKKPEEPTSM